MKMKLKKGDKVIVIAGKEKGKEGTINKVLAKSNKVVVEGLNKVTKHLKPTKTGEEGKLKQEEAPIHASNVAIIDPKTKKRSRVGYKIEDDKKTRISKKSSSELK